MRHLTFQNLSQKEMGYVIGLFLGDGHAEHNEKDRHYSVSFFLNAQKDQDIQNILIQYLTRLNLRPNIRKDKRCEVNRIRVHSKLFYFFLTKQENVILKDGYNINRTNFLLGILCGFIDAEGYVSPRSSISIAQKDGRLMHIMKEICEMFNIRCTIKKYRNTPHGWIWRGQISTSFKYLPHNSQKVRRRYGCPS